MTDNFVPTKHVLEKMKLRNVTWAEIIDTAEHPEVKFGPDHRGRMTLQKNDLAVIVDREGHIITVLLRDLDEWTDEDARARRSTWRTS